MYVKDVGWTLKQIKTCDESLTVFRLLAIFMCENVNISEVCAEIAFVSVDKDLSAFLVDYLKDLLNVCLGKVLGNVCLQYNLCFNSICDE